MPRALVHVDVFSEVPYFGNPLAVVLDGEGLSTEQMQRFTHWLNLSETTFVVPPTHAEADYRVRIFTPVEELPFAGHPTLGTCHAWLEARGGQHRSEVVVQECGAGLVTIRRQGAQLAFAAPPPLRSGPVDEELVVKIASQLRIGRDDIAAAQWVDNGPGWVAVRLASAAEVLAVRPGAIDNAVGVVGFHPDQSPDAYEVRAFFPKDGATIEDPVTGSLNASLAQWLIGTGEVAPPYVASQGAALGRAGRIYVSADDDGAVWIGGSTTTCARGEVSL